MDKKLKILFLCTGNSCRSQMAEGWTRHLKGDLIAPWSAGVIRTRVDPRAIQVMAEAGVDISSQYSKEVHMLINIPFDYVITVCDHARESCPVFPSAAPVVHVGFDDPPSMTAPIIDESETLDVYRRVRDEIRALVETLPDRLTEQKKDEHV